MPDVNVEHDTSKITYGVVSLLHSTYKEQIKNLWKRLEKRFGVAHLFHVPIPHFSYHVSTDYSLDLLKAKLADFASRKSSFMVKTEGLGVFNSTEPVLYIPVVRNPALSSFHRELWDMLATFAPQPLAYYHPDSWMPHITLIHGNIPTDKLPDIVAFLASQDFNWEIPIDNISVISSSCSDLDPELTFKLGYGT
ncbi:2'-5' RNA ligase family protein [candidate division WOR-3 bacterium]|nr:2'-5' RNA ligase family protein [candidate division WOR-3 bacterium]